MSESAAAPVLVEHLEVRDGEVLVLRDVSLAAERGSIYAILGRGDAPAVLLRCLAGSRSADAGRIRILGLDPQSRWRLRSRRVFGRTDEAASIAGRRRPPEVLLLDGGEAAEGSGLAAALRSLSVRGTATVLATGSAEVAEEAAQRIGVLARGRLVAEGPPEELRRRFRRIRYTNRQTETRTEFGSELDEFDAPKVQVRGWGISALVSNFDDAAFDRFRRKDGVQDAEAQAVSLPEVLQELDTRG